MESGHADMAVVPAEAALLQYEVPVFDFDIGPVELRSESNTGIVCALLVVVDHPVLVEASCSGIGKDGLDVGVFAEVLVQAVRVGICERSSALFLLKAPATRTASAKSKGYQGKGEAEGKYEMQRHCIDAPGVETGGA